MNSDHKEQYKLWMDLWNGNLELAEILVDVGCVVHQAGNEDMRGPEGIRNMVLMGREPFHEISFSIEVGPIRDGDMVAARWSCAGIYKGGLPGTTAPEGTPISFGGIDIWKLKDGKIIEYWVSSDGLHLMEQLNLLSTASKVHK